MIRRLAVVAAACGGAVGAVIVATYLAAADGSPPATFGDYFPNWAAARAALAGEARMIFRWEDFHGYQEALAGRETDYYPWPYPPHFLLLLAPFAPLPYLASAAIWLAGTFAFMLFAGTSPGMGRLAVAIAPAAAVNLLFGQSAFLWAGLIAASLRLAAPRPTLSGIMLALLTCKPQLAFLPFVALAAAGQWRPLAAAAAATAALVGGSVLWLGTGIWAAWITFLPQFADEVEAMAAVLAPRMATVTAALVDLGMNRAGAVAIQVVVTLAVALAVWRYVRRTGSVAQAMPAVLAGAVLAAPFAYVYDLAATALAVQALHGRREGPFGWEDVSLAFAWFLPLLAIAAKTPAVTVAVLAALFVVALRR